MDGKGQLKGGGFHRRRLQVPAPAGGAVGIAEDRRHPLLGQDPKRRHGHARGAQEGDAGHGCLRLADT